jgi:hypothetical protein
MLARPPLRRAASTRTALTDREILERIAGARPLAWHAIGGGHTAASRWRVELAGGRSLFVKVARDERSLRDFARELVVYENVRGAFLPELVGASGDMLVLEDLGDAQWPPPWPDDVSPLFAALDAVAATPPPALPRLRRERTGYWERIAGARDAVAALGACSRAWLDDALQTLIEAESRVDMSGDELVHFDVWGANVCFTARGAVLVDWGAAAVGNRWVDVAFALLAPPPTGLPGEGAWAALLAGHDAWSAVSPPEAGLVDFELLRAGWIQDLRAALPWAAGLLDLPPP